MDVKITKAEIKDGETLVASYLEPLPGHKKKKIVLNCDVQVHDDMKEAFQKMHKHFALLCDEIEIKGAKDIDKWSDKKLEKFFVEGFTITGSDEKEAISISGYKLSKYGTVYLDSPAVSLSSKQYPFMTDLAGDLQACLHEVEEYLFNGKRADDPEEEDNQLAMEFSEPAR